ncbi:hypothetical protein KOI35_26920 [Actinoplanes bogorensis]|uniref:Uncharacterized protein n=1 Tax=Paractinoplanes bogorensis TaxID=1610840 RepID=A0ABS5YUP6_9ACTN|nr:hypothetical protein [Actinoplanes bogorensis]MBU2667145.1 hypothetical protein [Actinoplanes bogorensis]
MPDRRPMRAPVRLAVFLVCAAAIVVLVAGAPPRSGMLASVSTRLAALLILVITLFLLTRRNYYRPLIESHADTEIWPLPNSYVYVVQRGAGVTGMAGALTVEQAKTFAMATLAPTSLRERLTERYEPGQRTLTQRVTIDAHLPEVLRSRTTDGPPPTVLFPLLIPPKGLLIDNLRVFAADGAELPILSYRQYLTLTAQVLRTLLNVAYREPLDPARHHEAFAAEHLALSAIMRRGRDKDVSGAGALKALDAPGESAIHMAAGLAERLASNYVVVAAVPWPAENRFVVTYERQITPQLQLADRSSGWIPWLKGRARLLLGSRPVDITVPLENACTAQSYHLLVDGQDGVYVGSQKSPQLTTYCRAHDRRIREVTLQASGNPPAPPYFRFRRRAGQQYAHFYTRFFPEPVPGLTGGDSLPSVRFRFFETPPGSVFRAGVAAVSATVLIWLIGFVSSSTGDPGTDAPAFLLVFPAIAAAWLGYEGTTAAKLLEGTLAARLSLMVTASTSLAACGLFMVYKAQLPYLHGVNPAGMRVLGIASLGWTILALISILNAGTISFLYLMRSWEFAYLASRDDELTDHKVHVDSGDTKRYRERVGRRGDR